MSAAVCAPPAWWVALKALHHFEPTGCGCGENGWWCPQCRRCAPCDTMRVAAGGIAAVRALHYEGKYWKKVRDGWFKHHLELTSFCYADMQSYPCNTVRLIEAAA